MKKLLWVLAFVAVFAAGFGAHKIYSQLCRQGDSCGRHAGMDCCKKDGSCDRHATEGCCKGGHCEHSGAGKLDSLEISVPGAAGETKACCKKGDHAAAEAGACCRKTEAGDLQACCKKHAEGDLQACCKKS